MTLKMAAPFRQTVEVVRNYSKLWRSNFYQGFSCREPFQHDIGDKERVKYKAGLEITSRSKRFERTLCKQFPLINLSCQRRYCSSTFEDRKCWKCGAETNKRRELFFCNCGVVQEVPSNLDYFAAFASEQTFDVDTEELSKMYKDLQRRLHPDKYSQKSKEEQAVADNQSAYVNKAYTTLLRPLSRGLYLLELHGDPLDESNTTVDPEFLMLMMEINEELSENQHDVDIVKRIQNQNNESLGKCIKCISEAFKNKDISEAKNLVIKLKYYTNVDEKIKEILRHKMDRWSV